MNHIDDTAHAPRRAALSLLWPRGIPRETGRDSFTVGDDVKRDLELDALFNTFVSSERQYLEIAPLLHHLSYDLEVLAYRQDVMEDLLRFPALCRCFEDLIPSLEVLRHSRITDKENQNELFALTLRLSELESYLLCVGKLNSTFDGLDGTPGSIGLRNMRETLQAIGRDDAFQRLSRELPGLLSALRGIRSVTIGVNLDLNLLPRSAGLLAVNKEEFTERTGSVLGRLLGDKAAGWECIAPLHTVPAKEFQFGQAGFKVDAETFGDTVNPLMVPLFRDLNKVLKKISAPVARALRHYIVVNTAVLGDLKPEIVFLLGACRLINTLKSAGLPFARPELRPLDERVCHIKNSYNINLARIMLAGGAQDLREAIVKNDVRFDGEGRVAILTGPNRGGKTTYTQAVGLCQVFAQLGLPVPGEKAVMSPVDGIYTHFPVEEKIDYGTGRLGDEAKRIDEIFSALTGHSLLLLNESLSSTSADESFYIASDVVRILARLGARCIFTTHLHELATAIGEINRTLGNGEKLVSLVAVAREETKGDETKEIERTFRIVPGPPAGMSYAREIAERFGVSYRQLEKKLRDRGLLRDIE